MQRCTSSDTLHSAYFFLHPSPSYACYGLFLTASPRFSHVHSLSTPRPTLQFERVAERARAPGIPTSRDYFRFYPRRRNCGGAWPRFFPKNSNIKSSAQPSPRGAARKEERGDARNNEIVKIFPNRLSLERFFIIPFLILLPLRVENVGLIARFKKSIIVSHSKVEETITFMNNNSFNSRGQGEG